METTVANLRLLCQRHNLLAAGQAFGEELMRRYRRGRAQLPATLGGAAQPARFASPANVGET